MPLRFLNRIHSDHTETDSMSRGPYATIDGVEKSPIYVVVAGSRNARRTSCTPALT